MPEIVDHLHAARLADQFEAPPEPLEPAQRLGRLLVFFQPHGYAPLRVMGEELTDMFAKELAPDDILLMPDPVYYGGTTNREVGSAQIVAGVLSLNRAAEHLAERSACADRLVELARPGDRIVVMGARDDTLTQFAEGLLERLS